MSECERCKDLNTMFRIRTPKDLSHAIRIAKESLADKTISTVGDETGKWSRPFDKVDAEGGWDDIVEYVFACNSCGRRFQLSAETYHGSSGEWRPL